MKDFLANADFLGDLHGLTSGVRFNLPQPCPVLKVGNGATLAKATFPSFLGAFRDLLLEVDFRFGFPLREPFEPLEPRDTDLDLDLRLFLDLRCLELLRFLRSSWLNLKFFP